MITKEEKNKLIGFANDILSSLIRSNGTINKSYNGQIAAFSVTVALSGLKPALMIYMSDSSNSDVDKKVIVDLLAEMYNRDKSLEKGNQKNRMTFFESIIRENDEVILDQYREDVMKYSIALKLAVRTFKLA